MNVMGKKRKSAAPGDRHRPHKVIRLSPKLYGCLQAVARRNNRPVSWEIREVLARWAAENGFPVPDEEEPLEPRS